MTLAKSRIHTNHTAPESARAVNARAYAYGGDIIFDTGQYEPATVSGQRLIAHELAHVIQQERGGNSSPHPMDNSLESAAELASSATMYR